jgi:hypothetical protein
MNPETVKFSTSPVEATAAESELVVFRSELSSYNPSSNKFIRINLPVADKSWIDFGDSVLSLKFTNRSFDDTAASTSESAVKTQLSNLIKSISILNSQGEQVEYINNYNLISNVIDDYTMSTNHKAGVEQILAGGSANGDPDGASEVAGANATSEADGSSLVLVDRLMTGFTSGQYLLPLGYLVGQAPAIVLELEDPATALKINTAANTNVAYAVSEVQIRAKQIRFNSAFNMNFEQTMAEAGEVGVNYITETFLHNQGSLNSGVSGQQNVPFSVNPRSAKYILAVMRLEANVLNKDKYSLATRHSASTSQYSFEIGGKLYPTQPIDISNTNYAQAYANVLDCFGQIGNLNHNTLITTTGTRTLFYNNTQSTDSKFVAGLVLEDFNSATNASTYSGANLSTVGQMTFRPKIDTALSGAYRVDFITSADMSLHFTLDGRMYSVK